MVGDQVLPLGSSWAAGLLGFPDQHLPRGTSVSSALEDLTLTASHPAVAVRLPSSQTMTSPRGHFLPDNEDQGCHDAATLYLKDLKSSDVQDPQERSPLPVGLVQGFVHTAEYPAEKALIGGLSQSFYGKVGLQGGGGHHDSRGLCFRRSPAHGSGFILSLPVMSSEEIN